MTEEESLILITVALAKHRGPNLAKMIMQHIEGCSRMYNLLKEKGLTEAKWFVTPPDPDEQEQAEAVTGSEPHADEPHAETVTG